MAAAPIVLLAVAAAASASGAIMSGVSAKKQADAQARQQENEAKVAGNNALLAGRDAQLQADALAQERRKALATSLVAGGASGIELSGGSFGDSQFDTALSYEKQIALAHYRGDVEAYNYRNQSSALLASAKNTRSAGRWAMASGFVGGVGHLAGGAGNIALYA